MHIFMLVKFSLNLTIFYMLIFAVTTLEIGMFGSKVSLKQKANVVSLTPTDKTLVNSLQKLVALNINTKHFLTSCQLSHHTCLLKVYWCYELTNSTIHCSKTYVKIYCKFHPIIWKVFLSHLSEIFLTLAILFVVSGILAWVLYLPTLNKDSFLPWQRIVIFILQNNQGHKCIDTSGWLKAPQNVSVQS